MESWNKLSELISKSHKIILSTHIDPDGDGLGSEIAFYLYLKSINKDVTILNISDTPNKYKFIDENNYINTFSKEFEHIVQESDLLIVFDLGDFTRIGKIGDIFNHRSVTTFATGVRDSELFGKLIEVLDVADNRDFIFANFVEFDSLYGHRRDVSGYALALEKFDLKLPELFKKLNEDDLLIITADHGNDPTFHGTDHTRERVPVLIRDPSKKEKNYGLIHFSDVGNFIVDHLNLRCS